MDHYVLIDFMKLKFGHRQGECLKGVDMDCKKDDWKPGKPGKPGKPCDEKPCCNRDSEASSEQ